MPQQYLFESTVDEYGRIAIPLDVCQKLDINVGDRLRFLSVSKDFLFQSSSRTQNNDQ